MNLADTVSRFGEEIASQNDKRSLCLMAGGAAIIWLATRPVVNAQAMEYVFWLTLAAITVLTLRPGREDNSPFIVTNKTVNTPGSNTVNVDQTPK